MKYLIITLILLSPIKSEARDYYFNIGLSSVYTSSNELIYTNEHEQITNPLKDSLSSINLGFSREFKGGYVLSLNTNRLYSKEIKRSVSNNLSSRSRVKADTFCLGKRYNKWLPMFCNSNVEVDKSIWDKYSFLGREIKHFSLPSININYFIRKNISIAGFYLFPVEEIYLKSGFGGSINYYF